MFFRFLRTLAALGALAFTQAAAAQSPEDIVRWLYTSLEQPGRAEIKGLNYLTAPEQRSQFLSQRLIAFYEANESHADDLASACVDFAFDIPGQDFDAAEIARSLTLDTTVASDRQSVTARFTNFGVPAAVTYDFVAEGGFWRMDDIAGDGFRVSQIPCESAAATAQAAPAKQYCFQSDTGSLRLDVDTDGIAAFNFESWQANGHVCGGSGAAKPTDTGWVFEDTLSGGPCRMEFLVTPKGGIRLTDKDWACKPTLCGARAVIDGLTFPPEELVACATVPRR